MKSDTQQAQRPTNGIRQTALLALGSLLLSALLLFLAYQARPSFDIEIGTPADSTLVDGFWEPEHFAPGVDPINRAYRWMRGYGTITFRDVGIRPYTVALTVNGVRPAGQEPARLTVAAGGSTLLEVEPFPARFTYTFTVPAEALPDGTLTLDLTANAFKQPGDSRELGLVLLNVAAVPQVGGPSLQMPPAGLWSGVLGTSALIMVVLVLLGWGAGGVVLGGVLPALLASGLLIWDRLWLTSRAWYGDWVPTTVKGIIFAALVYSVGGWILRRVGAGWTPGERRALVTIAFAAFVIRLGGELHPQIFVFDVGFHANRLLLVEAGQYLFSTQPAEFGGVGGIAPSTFYLPTPYFFVIPLEWLVGDARMAIRLLLVTLGTLSTLPIFYLAKRFAGSGRAGIIAALLSVTLPMGVLPYSWGIMPNIFGEFFALLALAAMAGAVASGTLHPRHPVFYVLLPLFTIALLGHPGVVFLFGAAAALIPLLWLLSSRKGRARHAPNTLYASALWSLAALFIAGVVTFALYYHNFLGQMVASAQAIAADRSGGEFRRVVGGSVEDRSLGLFQREVRSRSAWVLGGIEGLWRESVAYYRVWPICAALLGFLLLSPMRGRNHLPAETEPTSALSTEHSLLKSLALGWVLTVLLLAFAGWFANVYVRYMLFALPVVSLGAGIFLARLWRHGRWPRLLVILTLAAFTLWAFVLWGDRITFAFKG